MDVFNEIPESLGEVSDDDLRSLRERLVAAGLELAERSQGGERLSSDEMDNARTARRVVGEIDAELESREAEADEIAEIAEGLSAVPDDEPEAELDDDSDPDGDEEDDDGDEDEDSDGEDVVVASARPARRPTAAELNESAPRTPRPITPERVPDLFKAVAGVSGYAPGDSFESTDDLSKALMARWQTIKGGGAEKLAVARLEGNFDSAYDLRPGEPVPFSEEALVAGLGCVPREPLYDVGCASSEARPVAASLPNRRAPRGGYSQYPSPMLADVTDQVTDGEASGSGDGTGIWTRDDDDDPAAVKADCAVIPCGTPQDWDIYGVYRCITVKNLHQMAHPELVSAFLNKLGALWARLAETTLLDTMATARPTYIEVTRDLTDDMPLSATTRLMDTIIQAATVYREQERYGSVMLQAWAHRWVQTLLIRDWLHRSRYDESNPAAAVIGQREVNAALSNAGVSMTWTLDAATDWESVGTQAAGELEPLPTQVDLILTPEGNFQKLDEGGLTVGVTNRVPWDLDDMKRNQFTMFWESYEGLLDLGCPSWGLSVGPLCPTGFQFGALDISEVTCTDGGSGDI